MLREIYCSPRAGSVTMLLDLPPLRTVPSDDVASSFVAGIMDWAMILAVSEKEIMELSLWRTRSLILLPT